jgi:hypothetical protein
LAVGPHQPPLTPASFSAGSRSKESEEGSKERRLSHRCDSLDRLAHPQARPPAEAPSPSHLTSILQSPSDSRNGTFGRGSAAFQPPLDCRPRARSGSLRFARPLGNFSQGYVLGIHAAPRQKRGRLQPGDGSRALGVTGPSPFVPGRTFGEMDGEQGLRGHATTPLPAWGLSPMRWSPKRSRLDSEVGASALAEGSIQFPLTPASHPAQSSTGSKAPGASSTAS